MGMSCPSPQGNQNLAHNFSSWLCQRTLLASSQRHSFVRLAVPPKCYIRRTVQRECKYLEWSWCSLLISWNYLVDCYTFNEPQSGFPIMCSVATVNCWLLGSHQVQNINDYILTYLNRVFFPGAVSVLISLLDKNFFLDIWEQIFEH